MSECYSVRLAWNTGAMIELSTIESAPPARAMSAHAAMSVTCMRGLVGLSIQTRLVLGCMARLTSSRLHMSTWLTVMPAAGATRESSREVPP